jgi:hypothetical protein
LQHHRRGKQPRTMKVSFVLLLVCGLASALGVLSGRIDPQSMLDRELPPPPRHHALQEIQQAAAQAQPEHSLLAVATTTTVNAKAALEAKVAAETALAVDESILAAASVEDTVTTKGQLTAEEQALVDRMIPIPKTFIPSDPAKPIEYTAPPTRDALSTGLGPRGYPWPEKLQNALNTIQEAAKGRILNIKKQVNWQKSAQQLVSQLGLKKNKVTLHVAELTKDIKNLLGKKKQIENKILQDKLVERLEVTHGNLKKVRRQTHNIRKNQAEMIHHKEELAHALEGIKRSLAILKGMKRERQFPQRGAGQKLKDELSQFDPDLSFEKEADEVRALQFPDAVLAEADSSVEEFPADIQPELVELQSEVDQE